MQPEQPMKRQQHFLYLQVVKLFHYVRDNQRPKKILLHTGVFAILVGVPLAISCRDIYNSVYLFNKTHSEGNELLRASGEKPYSKTW